MQRTDKIPIFPRITAVLFDMDGTLVDSEIFTEPIIRGHLAKARVSAEVFKYETFHGMTWEHIVDVICQRYPQLASQNLAHVFDQEFHQRVMTDNPLPIPGSANAVVSAAAQFQCGVVSSSHRATIDHVVTQLELDEYIAVKVGAEDVTHSKPNPECFQQAAQKLGHNPRECLVFEDSLAGLEAAKTAGMWTIAINHRKSETMRRQSDELADYSIEDYSQLPTGFFTQLKQGDFS